MSDALELMLAVRVPELDELASQLRQPKESVRRLTEMQPCSWAEQLAQLATLSKYADSLAEEFAEFVAK